MIFLVHLNDVLVIAVNQQVVELVAEAACSDFFILQGREIALNIRRVTRLASMEVAWC